MELKTKMSQFVTRMAALAAVTAMLPAQAQLPTRYAVTPIQTTISSTPSYAYAYFPASDYGSGPKINNNGWINLGNQVYYPTGTAPNIILHPTSGGGSGSSVSYDINDGNVTSNYYTGRKLTYSNPPSANRSMTVTVLGCNNLLVGFAVETSGSLYPGDKGGRYGYCNYNGADYLLGRLNTYQTGQVDSQANDASTSKIVGYSFTTTSNYGNVKHACWWAYPDPTYAWPNFFASTAVDYGTLLSGDNSEAFATNGNYVVGFSNYTHNGVIRATLFNTPTTNQDLGTLGGATSCATDINAQNTIVGTATTAAGDTHAFILPLGNPGSYGPTVIQSGKTLYDLNDYVPGGNFTTATGINNSGQIVVFGGYTSGGTTTSGSYLLTPY